MTRVLLLHGCIFGELADTWPLSDVSGKLVHSMITHHFELALKSPDSILARICSGDCTTCLIFGGTIEELLLPCLQLGWLLIGPGTIPPSTTSWRIWLHAVPTLLLAGLLAIFAQYDRVHAKPIAADPLQTLLAWLATQISMWPR